MNCESHEKRDLKLGFIPLTDCEPLVVAKELGYFAEAGLNVSLEREANWGSIRDKVSYGLLDGAQMLSPLPLAATLGLGTRPVPMVTGLALSYNGLAITLSRLLIERLFAQQELRDLSQPAHTARALKRYIDSGSRPLTLATVYPYSCHYYQLHNWLQDNGIEPGRDLKLIPLPPTRMLETLSDGAIDGYCVGEPWNSLAELHNVGRVVASGHQLWPGAIEKVFGVTADWAARYPQSHRTLLQCLRRACQWLGDDQHQGQMRELLAKPQYLGKNSLTTEFRPQLEVGSRFWQQGNRPDPDYAVQVLQQMKLQGQWQGQDSGSIARQVYRPELIDD